MALHHIVHSGRRQIREANLSTANKVWIIGSAAIGTVGVGYLVWRHYHNLAAQGGGPEGTGEPGGGGGTGGEFPTPPPKGGFGGPTGPKGQPQGQGGGATGPKIPTIPQSKRSSAIVALCSNPTQIQVEEAATILRAWVIPQWRFAIQDELAPSASQLSAAREAVAQSLRDVCMQPVAGLNTAINEFADAAEAIMSGSRFAAPIVTTTSLDRVCAWTDDVHLPLTTHQSLTLIIDTGLDSLRKGGDRFTILERVTCEHAGSTTHVFVVGSQVATAAQQLHTQIAS